MSLISLRGCPSTNFPLPYTDRLFLFIKSLKQCCDSYESSALSNILIGLGHDYGLHCILLISNQTAPILVHVNRAGFEPAKTLSHSIIQARLPFLPPSVHQPYSILDFRSS